MITRDEILKGQVCPQELEANLQSLLLALNKFRQVWGHPMVVTSGYRTAEHNLAIGGARNSAHTFCMAADIKDEIRTDHPKLSGWIQEHGYQLLVDCGLWMEDPSHTFSWVHLQIRPAIHRIFIP